MSVKKKEQVKAEVVLTYRTFRSLIHFILACAYEKDL